MTDANVKTNVLVKEKPQRKQRVRKIATIDEHVLPTYTRGEEIFNMVTHIVGAAFGIAALALCIIFAIMHNNPWGVLSGSIYGISMIMVYTISSVYHGLYPNRAKKIMQVLDHCDIYFLIVGSYAPMMLGNLRIINPALAWGLFGTCLGVCIIGTVFTAIDFTKKSFKIISYSAYFVAGWSVIFAAKWLLIAYPPAFFGWLLGGGIVYMLGMIFYACGHKKRYFHSIFHLFIIAGSVLQFVGFLLYCM